jgi:hypothetical protein
MKTFTVALAVAAVHGAALPDQQINAAVRALLDGPVKPWGIPDLIAAGMQASTWIKKLSEDIQTDYKGGKPIPAIVDETIPKIFNEAPLLKRLPFEGEKIRAEGIKKKALFGPFVLSGKNVRLLPFCVGASNWQTGLSSYE